MEVKFTFPLKESHLGKPAANEKREQVLYLLREASASGSARISKGLKWEQRVLRIKKSGFHLPLNTVFKDFIKTAITAFNLNRKIVTSSPNFQINL